MKTTLINPYISKEETYGKKFASVGSVQPPLGLCYLAAVLEKEGYDVSIIDAVVLALPTSKVLEIIRRESPDIIGIYSTTVAFHQAKYTAEAIKEFDGSIPIVIGGPHLSGFSRKTLEYACIDYGVIGEGEYTFLELIKSLENGFPLQKVQGMIFREGQKIVQTTPRPPIDNLDELPFPARHLLPDLSMYRPKPMDYKRLPTTSIITSRGCPYRCIFCDHNVFGNRTRLHSPEYVVSEIEHLIDRYGVHDIKINDDTFIINKKRVHKICKLIKERGLDVNWSCSIRANLVDKDLLRTMKDAGCWEVFLGVESGNQRILDLIKKSITLEQVQNSCRWARELGFQIKASFIIGHPNETEETIEETINFAKSLPIHYPSFTTMTPFPNTELWDIAENYGVAKKNDWSKLSTLYPMFVPDGLSEDLLAKKHKEAFRRVYFNPRMLLRHARNIRSIEDIKRYLKGAAAILKSG